MDGSYNLKTFSHTFSRKFEELVYELFKLEFQIHSKDIILTKTTRDGGKDVEMSFTHDADLINSISYKVWIEAKLKNKSNQVKLNDIAGNVIIAYNSNIRAIYFITTSYFTPQTYKELILNKIKTGLQITLIDGFNLRALLNKWENKLKEYSKFICELKHFLPTEKNSVAETIEFFIENETIKLKVSVNKERKIISQKVDLSKTVKSEEKCDLSQIKPVFSVDQENMTQDLQYKLTGKRRNELFNEIVKEIQNFGTIVLFGETGQGKTFFTHHIIRYFQNEDWIIFSISISNDNIITFTKKILSKFINLDYSDLDENYDLIIKSLCISYNLKIHIAKQIIKVLGSNSLSEDIAPEVCLEILKKSLINCSIRKPILLVIDDLDCIEIELFSFLINLFNNVKTNDISILTTIKSDKSDENQKGKDKLSKYVSALKAQKYSEFALLSLNRGEEEELIKGMLPGANKNIIDLIKENVIPVPLYIQLFIEYIKQKEIIVSKNGKFWILNDTSVLMDRSEIQSNKISTLIIHLLKSYFENKTLKKAAIYLYLLNNQIDDKQIGTLLPEWDEDEMCGSLFNKSYSEKQNHINFSHKLFYENIPFALEQSSNILRSYSEKLLYSKQIEYFDNAIKGKLFEHAGLFKKAYNAYLNYGNSLRKVDPHEAMTNYEKAFENFMGEPNIDTDYNNYTSLLCDLSFKLLALYNKYNLLYSLKASKLYSILTRNQRYFSLVHSLEYLFYMGQRESKQENFEEAHKYYDEAKQKIYLNPDLPENIIVKIISAYGISLKHLGLRSESIVFFEKASKKWDYKKIQIEKNSNIAAYQLTINPAKSLEYFSFIQNDLSHSSVHLDVDFAMAKFYIGEYSQAESQLDKAISRARDSINLSEEARALNILGLIFWLKGDFSAGEDYLDLAMAAGELANNYRWIWRIWANISQISCASNNNKAYNITWALIHHIEKTKYALIHEIKCENSSRRYAALKASIYVLHKLNKVEDIKTLIHYQFNEIKEELSSFYEKIEKENTSFEDIEDANFYPDSKAYFILG